MTVVLLFQDSGILSPYVNAAVTLWPVWIGIGAAVAAAIYAVLRFRVFEKSGIHETNQANIIALEALLETRNLELADAEKALGLANNSARTEFEKIERERDILQSEYKAIAGLVISELLHWAGRYEFHQAEVLTKDSEIRILKTRIELMEQREAEAAEIHKSQ